jgi:PIN domain nuclease of toxin-antitoxin system
LTTVLLDTHALYWWSAESSRLSAVAAQIITDADELAVAAISWFELAWMAQNNRIAVPLPLNAWLDDLALQVRTFAITPSIAAAAVALPISFPADPMDRLIYATAVEHGIQLVTRDERILEYPPARGIAIW